jgi:hypothetical protein
MNQMGRGALQVTVRANNRDVYLITAHLKSKLLTFPGGFTPHDEDERARFAAYALYRRASEATTLRAHLDRLLAGKGREMAVALMGDMNDEADAATTLILNGPPGSEIDTDGFDQPDQRDGDRMWNLAPLTQRPTLLTDIPRPAGADRPHLRQPLPRHRNTHHGRHHRRCSTRDAIDRGQPKRAPGQARLRPRGRGRDLRLLKRDRSAKADSRQPGQGELHVVGDGEGEMQAAVVAAQVGGLDVE